MPIALVTGATGCLGQAVCADLVATGWLVRSLSRHDTAPDAAVGRHFALDLSRDGVPPGAMEQADAVFHCAALSSAWGRAQAFHEANVTATRRLLHAARAAGVPRFVHVSTPSIYITGRSRLNVGEGASLPPRFINDYARTKYLSERLVRRANAPGFTTVTIRPRAIYGPHDRALLPRLMARLNDPLPLPLPGGGLARIDPTHATDAALAMRLAALAPADKVGGKAYNITSGQAVSLNELLDLLEKALGQRIPRLPVPYPAAMATARLMEAAQRLRDPDLEPALTRHAVAALGLSLTLDIGAARHDLGYAPRVTLAEGLARLARDAAVPRVPAQIRSDAPRIDLLRVGNCLTIGTALRRDQPPTPRVVPVWVAAITHPAKGMQLFDAGHGAGAAALPCGLPEMAFRLAVPTWSGAGGTLGAVLRKSGPAVPERIILSHLHADHVAGLFDLDHLPDLLASKAALTHLAGLSDRLVAVTGALPMDLARRLQQLADGGGLTAIEQAPRCALPNELAGLGTGHDLCGDGSVIAIPLPGHGVGQTGLWLPQSSRGPVILAADAAFSAAALRQGALPPAPLLARLGDPVAYRRTFSLLQRMMNHGVAIIASHDPELATS